MFAVTATVSPRRPGAVLEAVLERLTYVNEETGYTVARVATSRGGDELLTVVGALLGAQPGESLRLVGRWSSHPRYGRQFEVESYTTVLPATIQGIQRYLGSGLVKGIGPVFAERIVAHFGPRGGGLVGGGFMLEDDVAGGGEGVLVGGGDAVPVAQEQDVVGEDGA